jgi:tRNA A37 threonylcarbamoyladenosine dehydratase
MLDEFSRTRLLLGEQAMEKLKNAAVAVFGVGGVGSYCAEALARGGVGTLVLFDNDRVCPSNINRQLIATRKTVGRKKVEVMRERILEINPDAGVVTHDCFYAAENADAFDLSHFTYIVDAIDTVSSKLELILRAEKAGVPIISCMGAGNKLDPTRFEVADIYSTSVCPLARVMRRELKARGVKKLKVVYSREPAAVPAGIAGAESPQGEDRPGAGRRSVPGSVSFVPPVAGLILAGEAIKDIAGVSAGEKMES